MKNFSQITENLDVANKKYVDDGLSTKVNTSDIVQTTGQSTTDVMSQKAVTDEFDKYVDKSTEQTISGAKTFVSDIYISQTTNQNAGITWQSDSDKTGRGIFRHYDDGTTESFVAQSDGFLFRPLNNNNTKSIKVDPAVGALYPEQNSGADLGKTAQRWNAVYAGNTGVRSTGNIICDSKVVSYSAVESNNEVPNFNGILKDDLYTTAPTKTRGAQYLARDKNGAYIGGLRVYHDTDGSIQTQLMCRSQNTEKQKNVALVASKDSTGAAGDWRFVPNGDAVIDLGASGQRWNNGYITNLQLCKVINGGGGNSLIQQNSDTNGADITVGSTGCPLKIQGKNARPTYRQGKDGTYANLALQSDIPTNYVTTDTNQGITGKKWFISSGGAGIISQSSSIDLNKTPTSPQYNYIDFTDKADKRLGVVGSTISQDGYAGIYLQARNVASMGIKANASGEVYSWAHTPADNNNSDQIATTEWVRNHNKAMRGFDGPNYYTVDNVKHYYPNDNYFLVAYTDFCTNWQHVCAEIDVVDLDTRLAVYKLKVSGLLESATSNNITTYTNKGNIGITDSFGARLNTGSTDITNEFFLVCRTTNKGRVRYEIWYNQRYAYNRHKFYFSVDEASARHGITEHFPWNKMRIDNATDVGYAKAGVTAYMDSKKINPTYIPTSSWGVDVFKTAVSKDESYTNVTIFKNNLYNITQTSVSTILNTTPYIDAKIQGYNGYKTTPSAQKTAEYRILSEDKGYLGGIRYDRYTNGDSNTRLCTTSTLSGASNSVMLYATKGTASTKNTDSDIWQFSPATNNNINLGGTNNRWKIGYVNRLNLSSSMKVVKEGDKLKIDADATNGISFAGTKATKSMIRFLNNDANTYGNGIVIGGGGVAIIGGGESADSLYLALVNAQVNAGETVEAANTEVAQTEQTYITSDNSVRIFSGCNTIANRKELDFNTNGQLVYTPTAGGTSYTYTLPKANGTMMVGSLSGTVLTISL